MEIIGDLRFALRSLRRRPAFLLATVLTLALGIGANTAIFSLIDAVLLHPLDVARPSELMSIHEALNERAPNGQVAYPTFRAMEARTKSFTGLAGFKTADVAARVGATSEQITAAAVSGNYFSVLGVSARVGRTFTPKEDDVVGTHPVVVISDEYWQAAFSRREDAIGSTMYIGPTAFTVIGVLPRGFRGTQLDRSPRVWVPLTMMTSIGAGSLFSGTRADAVFSTHAFGWIDMVGRLAPRASAAAAAVELNGILAALASSDPTVKRAVQRTIKNPMTVMPAVEAAALSERALLVRFVSILVGVVVLTLLVACVNVANLMLVRATERARELGVRAALGASRARLIRQLFLESLVLAGLGAIAGIAVSLGAMRLLTRFRLPGGVSLAGVDLGLDTRVLAFTAGSAIATALLFGLVPSIRGSRLDLIRVLRAHGMSHTRIPTGVFVSAQVAMSLVLLVSAGLFLRSLRAGLRTDLGFDPKPLAAISFDPRLTGYDGKGAIQLFESAVDRARRIPGVTGAAVATHVPLANQLQLPFALQQSAPGTLPRNGIPAGLTTITPEYFDVVGVRVVAGRAFTRTDDGSVSKVAVLNQSAAKTFFGSEDAIGRSVYLFNAPYVVVGEVADTKYESVRDSNLPVVFVPMKQEPVVAGTHLIVRTKDKATVLAGLRATMRELDPGLPVHDARLVGDQIDEVLMPQRFGATLLGIFAIVALAVSAAGIFGVVAFSVARRTPEIGIRIALGAQHADVVRLVAWRAGAAIIAGVVIGLVLTAAATRGLHQFLYGIAPLDYAAFGGATLALCIAAALAAWLPARRATKIDPMTTIRAE